MKSHEIDYEIIGNEMQVVEIELDPGETVIAEAGAMNYMDAGIEFETRMGDGSAPEGGMWQKLAGAGKRMLTGESLFITHFTNHRGRKKRVAFAAPYPGKILALDLSTMGGELICQKDAFLCAAKGTAVDIALHRRLGAGFFGGEGFILQKLKGDGMVFIHVGGTVIKREMAGEQILVDTGCLAAFTPGISYDITKSGNLKSMLFGGEGLFLADIRGHGILYLQSLPFSRLASRIIKAAPQTGMKHRGEGSLLGGIGNMIMGDND